MEIRYFLGANSARGFVSYYDNLNDRKHASLTRIIKGGPGCGKSTLMKKVAAFASDLGLDVERIPCSSDPDSLDGIVVPSVGYAIADGTAPHVMEPMLCGCNETYLDLSTAYRSSKMADNAALLYEIQRTGKACYPHATAALQAMLALEDVITEDKKQELTAALAEKIAAKELPCRESPATLKSCFLSGYTPKGFIFWEDTVRRLCPTVYLLRGSRCDVAEFLRRLAAIAVSHGWDAVLGDSPLLPGQYADQLLIPERGIAFLRDLPEHPWLTPIEDVLGTVAAERDILEMQKVLLKTVADHLRRAKAYHDLLEHGCAPYVDFSVADRLTQMCCEELQSLALHSA